MPLLLASVLGRNRIPPLLHTVLSSNLHLYVCIVIRESHVDVLVLGAGPAGVMCANGLARAGVHVRIIDKRCAPCGLCRLTIFIHSISDLSRSPLAKPMAFQPRTLEVLQSYGLPSHSCGRRTYAHGCECSSPVPYHPGTILSAPLIGVLQPGPQRAAL